MGRSQNSIGWFAGTLCTCEPRCARPFWPNMFAHGLLVRFNIGGPLPGMSFPVTRVGRDATWSGSWPQRSGQSWQHPASPSCGQPALPFCSSARLANTWCTLRCKGCFWTNLSRPYKQAREQTLCEPPPPHKTELSSCKSDQRQQHPVL